MALFFSERGDPTLVKLNVGITTGYLISGEDFYNYLTLKCAPQGSRRACIKISIGPVLRLCFFLSSALRGMYCIMCVHNDLHIYPELHQRCSCGVVFGVESWKYAINQFQMIICEWLTLPTYSTSQLIINVNVAHDRPALALTLIIITNIHCLSKTKKGHHLDFNKANI